MRRNRADSSSGKATSYIGLRIVFAIFSLFFTAAGVAMTVSLGRGMLAREDWPGALFLIIPILFAVLGAGGLYLAVFRMPWKEAVSASISSKAGTSGSAVAARFFWIGYAFFGIFLAAGIGTLVNGCLIPVTEIVDAMRWSEVPCVILESRLTKRMDEDGAVYGVFVRYRYWVNDKELVSTNFAPTSYSSRRRKDVKAILDRYSPGSEHSCYVSSRDATKTVLLKGELAWEQLAAGLMGLVFAVIGIAGIAFTASKKKKWVERRARLDESSRTGWVTHAVSRKDPVRRGDARGGVILKPKGTPLGRFFLALAFALMWNGFVWGFLAFWWTSESGSTPWWVMGIVGLFGIIGLFMIVGMVRAFRALFDPRPVITVDRSQARLGEPFRVSWRFVGREESIPGLTMFFEGIEEAKSVVGTETHTETHTFAHIPVAQLSGPSSLLVGNQSVTIPADSMHSFESDHNAIRWSLRVRADLSDRRRLDETFELMVGPQSLVARKTA